MGSVLSIAKQTNKQQKKPRFCCLELMLIGLDHILASNVYLSLASLRHGTAVLFRSVLGGYLQEKTGEVWEMARYVTICKSHCAILSW